MSGVTRIWDFLRREWRNRGHCYALAAGAILGFALPEKIRTKPACDGILTALISVSAILAGFLATGLTVLLALEGSEVAKMIRKLKLREEINQAFWGAAKSQLWAVAVCLVCLVAAPQPYCETASRLGAAATTATVLVASTLTARALRILASMMKRHVANLGE